MSDPNPSPLEPRWCLVGNIVEERRFGEGGLIVKRGTKHFSAGTKVYCLPCQWGDGYDQIVVVGRHLGERGLCTMIVPRRYITNWRAKLVYSPEVHRLMDEWAQAPGRSACWGSRQEIERYLPHLLERERGWNEKHPLPAEPESADG